MSSGASESPNLLSPIVINKLTVCNAIVSLGHGTRLADNHEVTSRLLAYHEARVRGGAGMIITEAAMVDRDPVSSTTHLVGDCLAPRTTQEAVCEGFEVGWAL